MHQPSGRKREEVTKKVFFWKKARRTCSQNKRSPKKVKKVKKKEVGKVHGHLWPIRSRIIILKLKKIEHLRCTCVLRLVQQTFTSLHIYFLCTTLHNSPPAAAAGGGKGVGAERAGVVADKVPWGSNNCPQPLMDRCSSELNKLWT